MSNNQNTMMAINRLAANVEATIARYFQSRLVSQTNTSRMASDVNVLLSNFDISSRCCLALSYDNWKYTF